MEIKTQQAKTTRGHERCTLFLDVAEDLFLKYGYNHISLDQIVEQAGGSKSTIYKYFGNKKGLFLAMCQIHCDCFVEQMEKVFFHQQQDITKQLRDVLLELSAIFGAKDRSSFMLLIVQTAQDNPDIAQELYNIGAYRMQALLAEYLENAHKQNLIYCENPKLSARYLLGFFNDMHWRKLIGLPLLEDGADIHQYVDHAVKCFLDGHRHR